MKKFLCVVLSLVIVLSSLVVYADTDTLFNAGKNIKSANTCTEFTVRLNKPFDFITELTEEMGNTDPIDIKQLAESGVSITENADVSYFVSDDGKKIKLAAASELDVPLVINSDFKADIWTRTGMWIEMDITDEENPVLCIIYKTPFSNKYYVIDYSDIRELDDFSHEKFIEGMKNVNNDELFGGDEKFFKELILDNVKIEEKTSNKLYRVTTDDTGFKNIVKGIAGKLFDAILEALTVYEEIDNQEWRYQFEEYMSVIDDYQIIGKDGISATVTLDSGNLKVVDYSVHINFNLHDLITAYGGDLEEYNRDLWEIDLTFSTKTEYENVNEEIKIDFPEITEENSNRVLNPTPYYYENYSYVNINPRNKIECDENGMFLVDLSSAMMGTYIAKQYYTVENGVITIAPREEQYDFTQAKMTVGSDVINIDGNEFTMSYKVEENENYILIPIDALTYMMGYELSHISGNMENGKTNIGMKKIVEKENVAAPASISNRMYIYGDGNVVTENNELYISFMKMMNGLGVEEENIVVDNGEVSVKNSSENIPEFSEIKLVSGSNEAYINGEKNTLDNPVIEKDGEIYVPKQLIQLLDCKIQNVILYFDESQTYIKEYNIHIFRNKIAERNKAVDKLNEYVPERIYCSFVEEGLPVTEGGEYYVPLNPFMGELEIRLENIIEDGETVTVIADNPQSGFETMTIKGTDVKIDDASYTMTKPMIYRNEKYYLPLEFVKDIKNGEGMSFDIMYNEPTHYSMSFYVPNPLYAGENNK